MSLYYHIYSRGEITKDFTLYVTGVVYSSDSTLNLSFKETNMPMRREGNLTLGNARLGATIVCINSPSIRDEWNIRFSQHNISYPEVGKRYTIRGNVSLKPTLSLCGILLVEIFNLELTFADSIKSVTVEAFFNYSAFELVV